MAESSLTRDQRRKKAIALREKRNKENALKISMLPKAAKERHIRRYRRPKTRQIIQNLSRTFEVGPVAEHKGNLKVLFISASDYAFLGHSLARCLKSVGVEALAVSDRLSPLRPASNQGKLTSKDQVIALAKEAYTIVWMHSLHTPLPSQVLQGTRCVVFHGGTRYRRSSKKINALFNDKIHLSLVQTGELLDRGAKNEHWLLPPVDTIGIKPDYSFEHPKKLIIGHFSSHLRGGKGGKAYVKGTVLIQSVIERLQHSIWRHKFEYRKPQQPKLIPWKKNIERMSKCDIYIESLAQGQQHNQNKHDWSIQALEACSLGSITISNFLFEKRYQKEYGDHGLIVANTGEALERILIGLFQKDRDELLALKHQAREWVEQLHSYEAVGNRLKEILKL